MALNAASATANTQNATAFMTGRTRRSSASLGRASTGAISPPAWAASAAPNSSVSQPAMARPARGEASSETASSCR